MSVWSAIATAYERAAHRHRWSATWVFTEKGVYCWRVCACGDRQERRVPTMEWAWRHDLIDSNPG